MDPNRLRRLNVRLSQQEWDKVHKLASNTTCRSTSEYARKLLTGKPVRVFYRNQSFDELEQQMIRLLPRLETIGSDFAQAIQKLDSGEKTPEPNSTLSLLQFHAINVSKAVAEIRDHIVNPPHPGRQAPLFQTTHGAKRKRSHQPAHHAELRSVRPAIQ